MPQNPRARPRSILVVSDPGLPTRRMHKIEDRLRSRLEALYSGECHVITRTETIRLRPDNTLDVKAAGRLAEEYYAVDAVLLLTEIPRHSGDEPLVAEIFPEHSVGVISCPTLGAAAPKARIVTVLLDCLTRVMPPDSPPGGATVTVGRDRKPNAGLRWTRWSHESGGHLVLRAARWMGSARTVMGMTVANDPWRTAPRLSSALAAAAATGAFGIFYSSIWQMAEYLSMARLLSIGAVAVAVMVTWLIISNGLWDKPVQDRLIRVVVLYNLSTVLTLLVCVVALYLSLVVMIFTGSLIIIDPGFMSTLLASSDVHLTNYLDIAWLSAAMGVVAGGLGSSFDSRTDLKKLTHGQRERQRRYAADDDPHEN